MARLSRRQRRVADAIAILSALGLPQAQQNERSALCLLALLDLSPAAPSADACAPLLGITPIMDWAREHYAKASRYAQQIAWETEVWVAEAPSHLIHFNGTRFLGPYPQATL